MAVGADENLRGRPVGPDRPQQAAESLRISTPPGRRRAQHGGHEPSVAVEHDDGLEAVFVVMPIEQTKLLAAMHGVERIVEIEHDPLGHSGVGGAIEIDDRPPHAHQ